MRHTTYKFLTGPRVDLTTPGANTPYAFTWLPVGKTTTVNLSVVAGGAFCPAGWTAYTDTGMVTGGTAPPTYTVVNDAITIDVCQNNNNLNKVFIPVPAFF
jgi:hypothetical protein